MTEHLDHCTDVEILGSIEDGLVRWTVRFGHSGTLQELAANDTGISHWGLIDCHHVVGQTVGDDETTSLVLWSH